MTRLLLMVACALLIAQNPASAHTYTITPGDPPYTIALTWFSAWPEDTLLIMPGTYENGLWPLPLTNMSPAMVGRGGPEDVVLLGTGQQKAFSWAHDDRNPHTDLRRLTFSGFAEFLGAGDSGVLGCGAVVHFTDNIVENCGTGPCVPVLPVLECSGIIARNVFRNNSGYAIGTLHTSATIEDNEIYGNCGGIWDGCCTSWTIRRNHIHDNTGTAISTGYSEGGTLEYNVIERNGGAGVSIGRHGIVQHNVIRENAIGVLSSSWTGASAAVIHHNDIHDNTEANLKVTTAAVQSWDCTLNWWGSTNPATISQGILDCYDDPQEGACVIFEPFCTAPGCEVTPVEPSSWGRLKALYRH